MNSLEVYPAEYGVDKGGAIPPELEPLFNEEDLEEILVREDMMEINFLPEDRVSYIRINQWSINEVEKLGWIFNGMTFCSSGPSLLFIRKGYEHWHTEEDD